MFIALLYQALTGQVSLFNGLYLLPIGILDHAATT
ncbi:hypothetical protein SAMN05444682_108252 [Parapedobacter indicus]|uniref:Uncharacterized protein n=1 Tax=Parapedobacter indicus TaxID=1477437 RepID=A0A1I3Q4M1_9SPHI|nr:hypothetical protein CLV26_108253 [Parapedobacter indicus]SFJ28341.1 hypothetical protein SAMN05444682_108252 [Parapedobacter indicus]